jgi:hypothetical protein
MYLWRFLDISIAIASLMIKGLVVLSFHSRKRIFRHTLRETEGDILTSYFSESFLTKKYPHSPAHLLNTVKSRVFSVSFSPSLRSKIMGFLHVHLYFQSVTSTSKSMIYPEVIYPYSNGFYLVRNIVCSIEVSIFFSSTAVTEDI